MLLYTYWSTDNVLTLIAMYLLLEYALPFPPKCQWKNTTNYKQSRSHATVQGKLGGVQKVRSRTAFSKTGFHLFLKNKTMEEGISSCLHCWQLQHPLCRFQACKLSQNYSLCRHCPVQALTIKHKSG